MKITSQKTRIGLIDALREVTLKGFPNIKPYADAQIDIETWTPKQVMEKIYTPQPTLYSPNLERIKQLFSEFKQHGVNIFGLEHSIDFEDDEQTQWTLMPPTIEEYNVPLAYQQIHPTLRQHITNEFREYSENQSYAKPVWCICDGSHRIETARQLGKPITLLFIKNTNPQYPYYALPQPYSQVEIITERPEGGSPTKLHILREPHHKNLYRMYPTAGLYTGGVRK